MCRGAAAAPGQMLGCTEALRLRVDFTPAGTPLPRPSTCGWVALLPVVRGLVSAVNASWAIRLRSAGPQVLKVRSSVLRLGGQAAAL